MVWQGIAAVRAAIVSHWTSGQTEQITKLKFVKRQSMVEKISRALMRDGTLVSTAATVTVSDFDK